MLQGAFQLSVLVNGRQVTEYPHEGNVFIEGRKNSNYIIKLKNNSSWKVSGIVSVDGLSVLDGKPAGQKSSGYLIEPYGEVKIDGWRTSQNQVNNFQFSSISKSYAERSLQTTNNVGVVGVMFLKEKPKTNYSIRTYDSTNTLSWATQEPYWKNLGTSVCNNSIPIGAINCSAAIGMNSVGTGFGDSQYSPTTEVKVELDENPVGILCLYYDDKKGLEKRGIIVDSSKLYPDAFPGYSSSYVKYPVK